MTALREDIVDLLVTGYCKSRRGVTTPQALEDLLWIATHLQATEEEHRAAKERVRLMSEGERIARRARPSLVTSAPPRVQHLRVVGDESSDGPVTTS